MDKTQAIKVINTICSRIVDAGFKLNPYASTYIGSLYPSYEEFGEEGIIVQCSYIAVNLRASGDKQKEVKKYLINARQHKFNDIQ